MNAIAATDSFVRMELRQLEYFIAVADDMSFTRAAQRVHVVQSALSTSIKKLEDELAVELFDRSRQQIRLTPAGEHLREHARQLLRAARLAKDSLSDYRGHLTGTVEFGSLVTFGMLDVAKVLGEFHAAHPFVRIRLRLSQVGSSAYLSAIADGSLDLALVSAPHRLPPGIDMHVLAEEPMVFVCRADHRLAAGLRRSRRAGGRGLRRIPGGVRHSPDDRRGVRRRGPEGTDPLRGARRLHRRSGPGAQRSWDRVHAGQRGRAFPRPVGDPAERADHVADLPRPTAAPEHQSCSGSTGHDAAGRGCVARAGGAGQNA